MWHCVASMASIRRQFPCRSKQQQSKTTNPAVRQGMRPCTPSAKDASASCIVWLACIEALARRNKSGLRAGRDGTLPICITPHNFHQAPPIPATAGGHRPGCQQNRGRVGPRVPATARRRPTLSKEASRALRFSQVSSLSCCHLTSERDKKRTALHR